MIFPTPRLPLSSGNSACKTLAAAPRNSLPTRVHRRRILRPPPGRRRRRRQGRRSTRHERPEPKERRHRFDQPGFPRQPSDFEPATATGFPAAQSSKRTRCTGWRSSAKGGLALNQPAPPAIRLEFQTGIDPDPRPQWSNPDLGAEFGTQIIMLHRNILAPTY